MPSSLELTIEAILFATGAPISVTRLMEISKATNKEAVVEILQNLQHKYTQNNSAMMLVQMGEDWKFTVKKEFLSVVEKIAPDTELPKSIIETLAIIAWKSPVSQAEIVRIRSTKAYDHIQLLSERDLIEKDKDGRSYTIKLTPKFFEYFEIPNRNPIDQAAAHALGKKVVAPLPVVVEEQKDVQITLSEQRPLSEIKAEERQKHTTFLDDLDKKLQTVGERSDRVKSEINEYMPKVPDAANPPADENKQA